MAHIQPRRAEYRYEVAQDPSGKPYAGQFVDGGTYYNVLSIRIDGAARFPHRIVARTQTLDKAYRLARELTECTAWEDV